MDRLPSSDSALQKVLHTFGKDFAKKSKAGKRKMFIPVQSNSRARRKYELRGSRAVFPGRPKNGTNQPRGKEKHHLMTTVLKNKGATKKH